MDLRVVLNDEGEAAYVRVRGGGLNALPGPEMRQDFDKLIVYWRPILRNVARKFLDDPDDCDDLLQTTLSLAWQGFLRYDRGRSFYHWCTTIMRNVAIDMRRRRDRRPRVIAELGNLQDGEFMDELEDRRVEANPFDMVCRDEVGDRMRRSLEHVPSRYLRFVLMRDVEGLSYKQISDATGIKLQTVRTRIHRGRSYLGVAYRRALAEEEGIPNP